MSTPRLEERAAPECITLGVAAGVAPSDRPPVRIFLASEPAQERAERVFVWSIQQVRDPSRVYEIHLMKGLIGFRRKDWTTGFTNYRYAIPHFAGGSGRAIYNDVDQIYLADPARLFDIGLDTALGAAGYLSVSPDDPSVMLMDCARMEPVWPLADAQQRHKSELLAAAAALRGELDGSWNARDHEYRAGVSGCLHYTNLHTQPWQPFPERFVYQHNAQEELWFELERSADAAGFQLFTSERPSELYRRLPDAPSLAGVPQDDLAWLLDRRLADADGTARFEIDCDPPQGVQRGPDGAREPVRTAEWWSERLYRAAALRPGVSWNATLRRAGRPDRLRAGGPHPDGTPQRIWLLTEDRPGNTTQSLGLAEALGLPVEHKRLVHRPLAALHNRLLGASRLGIRRAESDPLEPPWPDLVIAAGRRTAPVALWIREQSAGRTRLVQLGRKGADRAALFDLAVTPTYCRFFPHPQRLEVHGPLHRVGPEPLEKARREWEARLAELPAPRIALLVGGTSGQYGFDAARARELGEGVARMAREAGGSVIGSASRRTSAAAVANLREALADVPGFLYAPGDPGENPYLGLLAWADELVVTADSESMLVEATAAGRPLHIYPLPERLSFRLLRWSREHIYRRATAQPAGPRGTGRPQQGLELWCARLLEWGLARPVRDLARFHDDLIQRGVARHFGRPGSDAPSQALLEAPRAAARVRSLLGLEEPPPVSSPRPKP